METKNYSLEKHLESLCADNEDYKILYSVWFLNKQNITAALKEIAFTFPHYSEHDITHTFKILDNIQRLLGRDRVERLGATDTFLLLMSALTHDLGMYMTYEMIEKKWESSEMDKLLDEYANSSDKVIAKAARLLKDHGTKAGGYTWALEIRNAVTLILAHQMRYKHGDRSAEHIRESNFFHEHANKFHFDNLPGRYLDLIAEVAHLHGTDFYEVLSLPQEDNGLGTDEYIHPRFVACMIRMGDLLDIDNNRFNPYSMALVKEMPKSSEAHLDKHQAVKHLLISPKGIEANLDCPTDASYRVASEVFDWLEGEVEKLSREWSVIAPPDLGGLPPVLHKGKINIYYKGHKPRPELMHLRFDISSQRTFEMLKGGAIYENPGRVFLREIVQNALDATKLQIWADIDHHLPFQTKHTGRLFETKKDLKDYAFSDDLPEEIYKKYPISLKVEYDEEKHAVIVTCEDYGTGISDESLIRMTKHVGASRRADEGYEKTIKEMPYFLQPTATFGLGLQTVFYVTDKFTVDTRCPGGNARRIIFRTSTDGSYCSLEDENLKDWSVAHGTKVTIVVDKEHLGKLFELDKKDSQECIDYSEVPYKYLFMIDDFVLNIWGFNGISFSYLSPLREFQSGKVKEGYEFLREEGTCRLYWREIPYGNGTYLIEDRRLEGHITITYHNGRYGNISGIQLHNIHITGTQGWWGQYAHIGLNLCSREADQLVTLSRNRLLPQGEEWCHEKIEGMLPIVVQLTHKHLLKQYQKPQSADTIVRLDEQYCALCLLNWNLANPIKVDLTPLNEDYLKRIDVFDIKSNQFFNKQKVVITPRAAIEATEIVTVSEVQEYLKKTTLQIFDAKDIITYQGSKIPDRYICAQEFYSAVEIGFQTACYRLKIGDLDSIHRVKIDDKDIQEVDVTKILHGFDRDDYSMIVVSKDAPLLGHDRPYHGNCWIYPIRKSFNKDKLPDTRDAAEAWLREEGQIEKLVPDYLVKIIIKHNILGKSYPDNDDDFKKYKKEIHDAYICLILDNKFGIPEPSKKQ